MRPILRRCVVAGSLALLALLLPRHASADLTAFVGLTPTPSVRPAVGVSGGLTLLVLGWELEYARTADEVEANGTGAPALRTYTGALLVQNPFPVAGLTFYALAAAGLYREIRGRETPQETSSTGFATAVGGGVKIDLTGPLRLRLDYRVFSLTGDATAKTPQRLSVGLTVRF